MFTFLKKLLKKDKYINPTTKVESNQRTVKDLEFFDDVWIKDDGVIYRGWIWDISRRCITVVYYGGLRDFKFQIPRPLTLTEIQQDNKVLYCNKPKEYEDN